MAVTHVSEAEAVEDIAGLLVRAQTGEEIVVETSGGSLTLRRTLGSHRTLGEALAIAEEHERLHGPGPVMDEAFARDMREVIDSRGSAPRRSFWD